VISTVAEPPSGSRQLDIFLISQGLEQALQCIPIGSAKPGDFTMFQIIAKLGENSSFGKAIAPDLAALNSVLAAYFVACLKGCRKPLPRRLFKNIHPSQNKHSNAAVMVKY
jgi:hypothetical protein